MTDNVYGPLVGPWDVEQQVIATLGTWLAQYLGEYERQHALTPGTIPRPEVIQGGLDFYTVEQEQTPAVIVICNPTSSVPELAASDGYGQWFQAKVGGVIIGGDEDEARQFASHYAISAAAALVQQGSLGGIATRTLLVQSPKVEFIDQEIRRVAVGTCAVNVFVQPIVDERTGPVATDPTGAPPDPANWPTVATVTTSVAGEPLA